MKDLYLSELRRFRNAAVIFAAAHLVLQLFVNRLFDLPQQRWEKHVVVLALYCLSGLGFALYQFGTYRQPSRWVWLLHRPLSRARIFGAIALASATLILLAVGLPFLLALAGIEAFSERTVDARHYLAVLHVVLIAFVAWLAGAIVATNRSRSAIVVLVAPWLMLAHLASAVTMLAPALLCVALLAYVAYCSFKPNRMAPPENGAALAATALPLQLGFYFALMWSGSVAFQCAQMLADTHPLNRPLPPAGGFVELTRADGQAAFDAGLAVSGDPRAPQWRRQLKLLTIGDIEPMGRQFPVRHQASNRDVLQWADEAHRIEWTFSHDAMRFHGRDLYTGKDRGWLGLGGFGDSRPFPAVPVLPAPFIMTPQDLFAWDADSQQVHRLLALRAPETLAGPPKPVGKHLYVLTNHRLIAYAPPADPKAALAEQFGADLPGPFSDLDRVDIAELLDGVLLSFNYGRHMVDGVTGATQSVVFVDASGGAQVVARRAIAHDFPALFEHRDWWVSPALHALVALPDRLLDTGVIADRTPAARERPRPVMLAALVAALLSAAGAFAWLRHSRIDTRRRAGWIAACLLIGPPALLSLMLLQPRASPLARSGALPLVT
jgi:hypothetical protein